MASQTLALCWAVVGSIYVSLNEHTDVHWRAAIRLPLLQTACASCNIICVMVAPDLIARLFP